MTRFDDFLATSASHQTLFKVMKVGQAEFMVHQWIGHELARIRAAEALAKEAERKLAQARPLPLQALQGA